jgi:hypothetical protein
MFTPLHSDTEHMGVPRVDPGLAAVLGCAGGAIAELVVLWGNLSAWQKARRDARKVTSSRRGPRVVVLPQWNAYIDPIPDLLVCITRLALGAVAGLAFHSQVTGAMAAITVGASAPTLLSQLGAATRVGGKEDHGQPATSGQRAAAE